MKYWGYISTCPTDYREERKISDLSSVPKGKQIWETVKNPIPTTPHVIFGNAYYHAWEEWLNLLGSQGWEVCSAGGYGWGTRGDIGSEFIVILKQEID